MTTRAALESDYTWGVATRSLGRPDPALHILWREGNEHKTWCGGGPATAGIRNVTGRTCPKCVTLAREDYAENGESADADSTGDSQSRT